MFKTRGLKHGVAGNPLQHEQVMIPGNFGRGGSSEEYNFKSNCIARLLIHAGALNK